VWPGWVSSVPVDTWRPVAVAAAEGDTADTAVARAGGAREWRVR